MSPSGADPLGLVVAAAAGLAIAAHAVVGLQAPLWLDEGWTGALASVRTFADLLQQARDEAGGPVYYILIWAWARLFGLSDISLHVPSLIFGLAAPGIAWFGLRRARPATALAWSVLLAVWGPGIALSGYARCYALLLCLAVSSTVASIRLLDAPTLRRAALWAVSAALMTLTHYDAGLLAALQGLVWVAAHRRRALALWPAALVFLPAFAWIAWHAPRLVILATPGLAWHHVLTPWHIPGLVAYLLGTRIDLLQPLLAGGLLAALWARRTRASTSRLAQPDVPVQLAGASAILAACLCAGLGMWRPTFTLRYLEPFAPGVLLLIARWITTMSAGRRATLAAFLAGNTLFASLFWTDPSLLKERIYNFETASAWIEQSSPSRLVFLWDNPTSRFETRHQYDLLGGFFLRRDGLKIDVDAVYPTATGDMNDVVLSLAKPDAAVLWLYDLDVHDTTAIGHPPRLAVRDPRLDCRDFGSAPIGIVACRRRPGGAEFGRM